MSEEGARLLFVMLVGGIILLAVALARAQEHAHPAADLPLHEKFYSTWYMPDQPSRSCCNKADCYPTLARWSGGQWWALRREDGEYIPVPPGKLETRRDNPDGRSHLCAPSPRATAYPPGTVFCFALGGGT